MSEKWCQSLDSGEQAAVVLTDLSKAFECFDNSLLIARLNTHGFNNLSLSFIYSYVFGKKQRTKINLLFSCWAEILFGVPKVQSWDLFCLTFIYVTSFLM